MKPKRKITETEVLRPAIVISGPSLRAKALKAQADLLPDMMAELMVILDDEAGRGNLQAVVPMRLLMADVKVSHEELALAMTRELGKLGCHARVVERKDTRHGGAWETILLCLEVSWREPTL